MDRVTLPGGFALSRIALGMWRITEDDTSPARVQAKLEACLETGITTVDQADVYGGYRAEAVLGAALADAPGLRDRIEIVTKCGIVLPGDATGARVKHYDTSAAHIRRSVETSLRNMCTDRIDLLLIHRPDPFMDACETAQALDALVASGKVRAVGVSNFRPHDWELLERSLTAPLATNQFELSLLTPDAFTNGDLAFLQARGIPPMAWSPLGGGALFAPGQTPLTQALDRLAAEHGTDRAGIALAWLLAHPARILPVLGTNDPARLRAAGRAAAVDMDRQTWFELLQAARGHEVP